MLTGGQDRNLFFAELGKADEGVWRKGGLEFLFCVLPVEVSGVFGSHEKEA